MKRSADDTYEQRLAVRQLKTATDAMQSSAADVAIGDAISEDSRKALDAVALLLKHVKEELAAASLSEKERIRQVLAEVAEEDRLVVARHLFVVLHWSLRDHRFRRNEYDAVRDAVPAAIRSALTTNAHADIGANELLFIEFLEPFYGNAKGLDDLH